MSLNLIGKKKGMTQVFDEEGRLVVCTVISAEPNMITSIKSKEKNGYTGVQLGAFKVSEKKLKKPIRGFFAKSKVSPCSHLTESRVENIDEFQSGSEVSLSYFNDVKYVDIIGTSKGKGFQGVMKLHGFKGGPAAHGSGFHRSAGSTGMRSTPGRSFPGGKRASRMGGERKTVQNLKVIMVDEANNVLIVQGAIPGSRGSNVYISKAKKK